MHLRSLFLVLVLFSVLLPFLYYISTPKCKDNDISNLTSKVEMSNDASNHFCRAENLNRELTLWSNDFHISVIGDLKDILQRVPYKIRVNDQSLSGHCHLTKTCATNLKVIRGHHMDTQWSKREEFFEAYKNDPSIQNTDMFFAALPAATSELFYPFNKSLIVVFATRYEVSRYSREMWEIWNRNLQLFMNDPKNIIVANSLYDAKYAEYFLGRKVEYIPSICGYILQYQYLGNPSLNEFKTILVVPYRFSIGNVGDFVSKWNAKLQQNQIQDVKLEILSRIYQHYEYSDLIKYRAALFIPYQTSLMSFFEYYRMNIPIIVPSRSLLAKWHKEFYILSERTWNGVFGRRKESKSTIEKSPKTVDLPFDPNNDVDEDAINFWIQYADFYTFPYTLQFNNEEELVHIIKYTDFKAVSSMMKKYNEMNINDIVTNWSEKIRKNVIENLDSNCSPRKVPSSLPLNQAWEKLAQDVAKKM